MIEDIPQAGENDPEAIDPFKLGGWYLLACAVVLVLVILTS